MLQLWKYKNRLGKKKYIHNEIACFPSSYNGNFYPSHHYVYKRTKIFTTILKSHIANYYKALIIFIYILLFYEDKTFRITKKKLLQLKELVAVQLFLFLMYKNNYKNWVIILFVVECTKNDI